MTAQASIVLPITDPGLPTGAFAGSSGVAAQINAALMAVGAMNWGPSAPANGPGAAPFAYQTWANTTSNPTQIGIYDGASWVQYATLNTSTHAIQWLTSALPIGTSGATIPLLNGNNTFSGTINVTGSLAVSSDTVVTFTAAQTLSNKTLLSPTLSGTAISTGNIVVAPPAGSAYLDLNSPGTAYETAVVMQLAGVNKWIVGQKAGTDDYFYIYNAANSTFSISIDAVTNAVVVAESLTVANGIVTGGASAILEFQDRTPTGAGWGWYSNGGVGRLYDITAAADYLTWTTGATGTFSILSTAAATSKTTGALVVDGGVGVAGNVYATEFFGSGAGLTSIPISAHAAQAANTLVGNATAGSASPTAFTIPSLTQKASPTGADIILISDQAASGALKYATVGSIAAAGSVSSIAGNTGAFTLGPLLTNSGNVIEADATYFGALFSGLNLSAVGGTNSFTCTAGVAMSDDLTTPLKLGSTYTKTKAAWAVGSGNGCLDAGSMDLPGWGYLYLIERTDTGVNDLLMSMAPNTNCVGATISIGAGATITWPNHGMQIGAPIVFTTTGALPTGLVAGTLYYVANATIGQNTFEVSATQGGTAITTSGTQSGVHTATSAPQLPSPYTKKKYIGSLPVDNSGFFLAITNIGDRFLLGVPTVDVNTSAQSTSAIVYPLSVPPGLPVEAEIAGAITSASAGSLLITSLDQADTAPGALATGPYTASFTSGATTVSFSEHVRTRGGAIRMRSTIASTAVRGNTKGWFDPNRRMI